MRMFSITPRIAAHGVEKIMKNHRIDPVPATTTPIVLPEMRPATEATPA